jgi:hypothetical protein
MQNNATSRLPSGAEGDSLADENQPGRREKLANARVRQRAIGRELRRIYDDVAQEPVPEEFLEILRKIDDGEKKPEE